MVKNRIYEDLSFLLRRAQIVFYLVEILFVLLLFYYWKVQILDHRNYWRLSEANQKREVILPAPRGLIYDRGETILVENIGSFKTSIIRENCQNFDKSCRDTSRLLNLEEDVLKKRIEKYKSLPLFKPIVVKENLSIEEVSRIEGRRLELPELVIETEPKRSYHFGTFAAHVLGYLQELSQEDLKSGLYKENHLGDLLGKTGIEAEYESVLRGINGKVLEVVDSMGRKREEIERKNPLHGQNIWLTLDFDIQREAEKLLEGKEGAAVVLDAKTGEVLALACYPTFDPNKFINRFSPEEWLSLVNNPDFPLENRAVRGLYSPGSLFKLTMALAALDSNTISEKTAFYCNGTVQIYGHPFSCWFRAGHGSMDLSNGIKNSCNIYFYNLGRRIGIDQIVKYASLLGFGRKTGIDLPGEKDGLVPSPEWKKRTRNLSWYPGETISVSIGQGPLLVTPLQVALHTALIANRGVRGVPHLVKSDLGSAQKSENGNSQDEIPTIQIKRTAFEKVIEGMWHSVNDGGTGRAARIDGFDICGKTGSTQLVSAETAEKLSKERKETKTHSWFTGFAPRDNPQVVVTFLVEFGGMGGQTAAPLARKIFDLYRKKYD